MTTVGRLVLRRFPQALNLLRTEASPQMNFPTAMRFFRGASDLAAPEAGADVASAKVAKAATANGAPRPLYRNALGQSWDGEGEYPDWLQRAVNAGQSIEFFRVE